MMNSVALFVLENWKEKLAKQTPERGVGDRLVSSLLGQTSNKWIPSPQNQSRTFGIAN